MKPRGRGIRKPREDAAEDPGFAAVLRAFSRDRDLAPIVDEHRAREEAGDRAFGSNGLKVHGKIFAMVVRGKLVVKLPRERVDALVVARQGTRFDPGHGRLMKEWVVLAKHDLSWVDLAREAHDFVRRVGRKR